MRGCIAGDFSLGKFNVECSCCWPVWMLFDSVWGNPDVWAQCLAACRKFWTSSRQKCPFSWGSGLPCITWFLGLTQDHIPNGISIGSAIFARLAVITDRHWPTDHVTASVAMWPKTEVLEWLEPVLSGCLAKMLWLSATLYCWQALLLQFSSVRPRIQFHHR